MKQLYRKVKNKAKQRPKVNTTMRSYKPSTQWMLSLERRLQIVSYRWCQKLRSIMPKFTVKVTYLRISHNRKHVNSTGLHFLLFLTIVYKHYGVCNKWVRLSLENSRKCILLLLTCLLPSLFIILFPDKISNKKNLWWKTCNIMTKTESWE